MGRRPTDRFVSRCVAIVMIVIEDRADGQRNRGRRDQHNGKQSCNDATGSERGHQRISEPVPWARQTSGTGRVIDCTILLRQERKTGRWYVGH